MVYNSSDIDNVERNQFIKQKLRVNLGMIFLLGLIRCLKTVMNKNNWIWNWLKSDEDVNEIKAKNMNEFDRILRGKNKREH